MIKSFKRFIEEDMTTSDVPVTQQGPYRNSGFLMKGFIRRQDPKNYILAKNRKQLRFEELETSPEPYRRLLS